MIPFRSWITAAAVALTSGVLSAQSPAPAASPAAAPPTPVPVVPKNVIPDIKARGKLIVGVKFDVRLFGLNNPITKKVEGLDADIARALAKALLGGEDKIEMVEAISANRIPFLQEDKVDLVISTMTITDARKQQIDFSDVYYVAGQSLLVPKGSPIKSVKDLEGKTVTTVQGSTSEKELIKQSPKCKPLLLKSYSECFTALQNGLAEAMTTDDIILMGYKASANDKFDLVGGQFTTEPYGIGIKKGRPDLLEFVNAELRKMKTDGRWKAIYDKHLKPVSGVSIEPPK
ncbi:MAG: glutamate ABC transporter substrate-binding protein [Verrucomicrobia bacterium]|nr:glutamate ABC transporter substrate-binding protein [Verrucomicrobiota bacterium]